MWYLSDKLQPIEPQLSAPLNHHYKSVIGDVNGSINTSSKTNEQRTAVVPSKKNKNPNNRANGFDIGTKTDTSSPERITLIPREVVKRSPPKNKTINPQTKIVY